MKMKTLFVSAAMLCGVALLATACNKSDKAGTAHMQVSLTDGPGDFEAVYIDVQDIKVKVESDSSDDHWTSLPNVRHGRYNLLELANGKDTLLSDVDLPAGHIEQIRLILGPENYVKIGGQMIKLTTPSAQQSGLKIKIHEDLKDGIVYKLLLDFDVAKSIHEAGNGKFLLRPVIRSIMDYKSTGIKGEVHPENTVTAVLAIRGVDTVASTFTHEGEYKLRGLPVGTYELHFLPADTLLHKQVRSGIAVTAGAMTEVEDVHLQ